MNPSPGDSWRGHGAPTGSAGMPPGNQPPVRPLGGFGLTPTQQAPQQQVPGPVLPPPSYHSGGQPSGHSLPTIADLTQGAPSSHPQPPPPSYTQHPQSASSAHSLPGLGQTMQQQSPQAAMNRDREREIRDHEMRERELIERQERQRQEDLLLREREQREREREIIERQREQQHHPVQSHTGSITLHQPVASKVTNNIHGPNGLLSGLGTGSQNGHGSLNSGSGPNTLLHASIQRPEDTPRSFMHQPVQPPAHTLSGSSPATMSSGQQPILNDALSYLDQVKVRFSDQPDVYNRFLDIMKDFKSQAIDTPGVIGRVSNLFNGHPVLIQGFNTFLPPGYRIECGTDDNPETIRVTTPSGTITQQLQRRGGPGAHYSFDGPDNQNGMANQFSRIDSFDAARNGYHQQQQISQGPASTFSPSSRPNNQPIYGQPPPSETPVSFEARQQDQDRAANAALVHQQEERGVSQLQSAVSAATNGASGRQPMMPMSPGPPVNLVQSVGAIPGTGVPGAQGDLGRRGPVEFNHAISYVNKIKNRFNQQPEIYKQFLEILQTYQRESRPIQDVYAQVTQLFSSAPDLLDDFKQFLPESAAQAKAAAVAKAAAEDATVNSSRNDPAYIASQLPQTQTPRPTTKMPPMGQFDPPSSTKEKTKRRGPPGQSATQSSSQAIDSGSVPSVQSGRIQGPPGGPPNKRAKLHHKAAQPEPSTSVAIDPTIVPSLPIPLPLSSYATQQDEFSFFDRVKKAIGNKATYTEFLKLINLFTQDMIDKHTLLDRARPYLDAHPDLITYFTSFLRVPLDDGSIEARALPDPGRVNLSHCRSLGPSYRYLPKREQNKLCKGRDEMCYEVLNDEWASYPTWASEDSGFIAHRKNLYEDGLHRLEEERHDYDTYIEACQRTIQLMDPLVQQIHSMTTDAERANFALHPGLGGQSETIYQRVIKKIYDRERGGRVIEEMFSRPTQVLPVVLSRLKQKLEEWKQGQREWEKVWREQQIKFYWKSLDHQGINVKTADKKMFQLKTMVTEIQAKRAEAIKSRENGYQVRKHQFEHWFADQEVLLDCCKLILDSTGHDKSLSGGEQAKVCEFVKDFGTTFFGIDLSVFENFIQEHSVSEDNTTEAEEQEAPVDGTPSSDHQAMNHQQASSMNMDGAPEEPVHLSVETREEHQEDKASHGSNDEVPDRWIAITNHNSTDLFRREIDANEPYHRKTYNMYCNANIYYFYRLFEALYSRLLWIKQHEADVLRDVRISMGDKAATRLGINDKLPRDYFSDVSAEASYYRQIVGMCELATIGGVENQNALEDTLRRFYLPNGYKLYGIANLLQTIARSISSNIFGNDSKDRSPDIFNLFTKDRVKEQTTRREEVQYRQQVSKLVKEGDVYKITWSADSKKVTVQILPNEEGTFDDDELDDEARYSYYISAYAMSQNTEGIDPDELQKPCLNRNLNVAGSMGDDSEQRAELFGSMDSTTTLEMKISPDDYAIKQWLGYESMVRTNQHFAIGSARSERWEQVAKNRREKFNKNFAAIPAWTKGATEETVAEVKKAYQSWIQEGPRDANIGDVNMADAS